MVGKKGQILIEVLMAATILGLVLVPILNFLVAGAESTWFALREVKAQALSREALEAVRSVRQGNWSELTDGIFYATPMTGVWKLIASDQGEIIGHFQRKIKIEPVYRNIDGQVVSQGGNLDSSTKKIIISVSWHSLRDRVLSLSTYLTRYSDNLIWNQTTQAEFDQGVKEYVETTSISGGEVQLRGGCGTNPIPTVPWIFDDSFQNTWQVHPSGKNNIKEISQPPGYVYQGTKALEISGFNGADTKLRNQENICTLGFTRLEFYAYNDASIQQSFWITGNQWNAIRWTEVVLPSKVWTFISIPYADVSQGEEENLNFIFFKPGTCQTGTKFYLDNLTLAGGVGGFYAKGTLTSGHLQAAAPFDATRETTFNRISFNANLPQNTSVGFQVATSNDSGGPWLYYGPNGTTSESDLYNISLGQGIWLGNNFGRYCRYKAFLFSQDGKNTPILYDVSINYAP